ncbi:hypothetical protein [Knoellia remsis]|uniref:hypothetical protein n=1 Tax=Knoellia remsis TaxID=407159 RepID=UPI0014753083|nr:hypothetical protein [Knoellia remsis]
MHGPVELLAGDTLGDAGLGQPRLLRREARAPALLTVTLGTGPGRSPAARGVPALEAALRSAVVTARATTARAVLMASCTLVVVPTSTGTAAAAREAASTASRTATS